MTMAFRPAASATATRSSTFSLREAAISTSTSSGPEGDGPTTWKSRLTSSSANGMYWLASVSTWISKFFVAQTGRHDDLLGDHRRRGQRHGDVLGARGHLLPAALHGFHHRLEIGDIAVDDRILGQGFDGVALHAQRSLAGVDELHHLYRGRTDVHPEQRRSLRLEDVEIQLPNSNFPFSYRRLDAI